MWKNMFYLGKEMQSLYKIFEGSSTTKMTKILNLNLDYANLLTKWLLDLNLDFADILSPTVIGFWIFGFGFEFEFCRYVNHNGYWI
jgi:hypothetical protein